MPHHRRSPVPALLLAAVLALGGCQRGAAADAAPPAAPATHPPRDSPAVPDATVDALRTVVEHDLGGASTVIEVVEVGADRAATMVVRTDDPSGPEQVRVVEEIVIGDDHYLYAPEFEAVFGVDLWIHFDLTDPRQRAFLEEQGPGLFARADAARDGDAPGVRVERERVRHPPVEPPSGRVVPMPDLHELLARREPG